MATKFGGKNLWPKCNAFLGSGVSWRQPEVKLLRNVLWLPNLVGRTPDQSIMHWGQPRSIRGQIIWPKSSSYVFKRMTYEALGAFFFFFFFFFLNQPKNETRVGRWGRFSLTTGFCGGILEIAFWVIHVYLVLHPTCILLILVLTMACMSLRSKNQFFF